MRLDVKRNAIRNVKYGVLFRMISIIIPFIIRTLFVRLLGMELLGLNSLCCSILQVLNLTEAGFNSAVANSMYEPIAKDDKEGVCSLINYFRKVYRNIGIVILVLGCSILPFLKYFVKDIETVNVNIYLVFSIYLLNTVLGYLLYAYKQCIWMAFQRIDLYYKLATVTNLIMYGIQIFILVVMKNYYLYLMIMLGMTIIYNLAFSFIIDKHFPEYKCYGTITSKQKTEIKEKVLGLMINKCSSVTRNSLDAIFISAFMGLGVSAIYSNYYYVLVAVAGGIEILSKSLLAGIGNNTVLKSVDDNYKDMERIHFGYMIISGCCSIYMLCLYQPFMELWLGKNNTFDFSVVICFSVYLFVLKMSDVRALYSDAIGLWWENRYWSIVQIIANIVFNFLGCYFFGVYGVVLSTVITILCIDFLYGNRVLFKHYFKKHYIQFMGKNIEYALVASIAGLLSVFVCNNILLSSQILTILLRAIACTFILIGVYGSIYRKTVGLIMNNFIKRKL